VRPPALRMTKHSNFTSFLNSINVALYDAQFKWASTMQSCIKKTLIEVF
jgi:hypothetical protein